MIPPPPFTECLRDLEQGSPPRRLAAARRAAEAVRLLYPITAGGDPASLTEASRLLQSLKKKGQFHG